MAQKIYPTLGFFITAQREKRGLSQLDFAREVGISKNTLAAMERDEGASSQKIMQLAKYLGIPDWQSLVRVEHSHVKASQPTLPFAVHAIFDPPNEKPEDGDPLLEAIGRIISTRPDILSVTFTRMDNSMWIGGEMKAEWIFPFLDAFAEGAFENIECNGMNATIDVIHLPKEAVETKFEFRHPRRPPEMDDLPASLDVCVAFMFRALEATVKTDGSMELRRIVQVPVAEPVTV